MDTGLIKSSAGAIKGLGPTVTEYFYKDLFINYPETRKMFPESINTQSERLFNAIVYIATNIENTDTLVPYLQRLGAGHLAYGTKAEHYPMVGASLLNTLEHFMGAGWTPEMADAWTGAYAVAAEVMTAAASEATTAP